MNWLDIILLVVVIASGLIGLRTGLIKEVAHLGGAVAGLIIAARYHGEFAGFFSEWLGEGALLRIVSFLAVFAVVFVVAVLLGWLISGSLKTLKLGWIDKFLGVAFGALRGVLLVVLILVALLMILPDSKPSSVLQGSSVYEIVAPGVQLVSRFMPENLGEEIRQRDEMHRGDGNVIRQIREAAA